MSFMQNNCLEKQKKVKLLFELLMTSEERYNKIIELGQEGPKLSPEDRIEDNLVKGCQSLMYIKTTFDGENIHFAAESDALISSGLAALLISVYSGENPETILKCPPDYLEELGITAALSPNRANGLFSLHLRMKQEALKILLAQDK